MKYLISIIILSLFVGVFNDDGDERQNKYIYIPITTAQLAYGGGDRIHQLILKELNRNKIFKLTVLKYEDQAIEVGTY